MNWIDAIIIVVCLLAIGLGIWRGFMKSLLKMFGAFASLVAALFLCKPFATLLMRILKSDNLLAQRISSWLVGISPSFGENLVGMSADQLSSHISGTLSSDGFPKFFQWLFKSSTNIQVSDLEGKLFLSLEQIISQTLTIMVFIFISFAVIAIAFFIAQIFLRKFVDRLKQRYRTINTADKVLGGIFGAVKGAAFVLMIFAALSVFRNTAFLSGIFSTISSSSIGGPLFRFATSFTDKYFNLKTILSLISNARAAI